MSTQTLYDLAIYDRSGHLAAVAEVKSHRATTAKWAAEFRRNIFAHGGIPDTKFFLMVTPQRLYLWKGTGTTDDITPPDYTVDVGSVFKEYLQSLGLAETHVAGEAFELMVTSWLGDLTRYSYAESADPLVPPQLVESGFLETIQGGRLTHEMPS